MMYHCYQNKEIKQKPHWWVLQKAEKGLPLSNQQDRTRTMLNTLREDCGIIRKQASTDGGVLWKVVCVNILQVRRKGRSLRDPREARFRVRV
ncbi:hypothetical protein TNCV_4191591 [Trichonephila clavipes]|nr:hypothetical protein TNCV_4191591 [Trichonephila clavipes]